MFSNAVMAEHSYTLGCECTTVILTTEHCKKRLLTENEAVDAIVTDCAITASKMNVEFQPVIILPDPLRITEKDFCALLGNLLDNALDACAKLGSDKMRYIKLTIDICTGNTIRICVKNSSNGKYKFKKGFLVTTKADKLEHGMGLKIIEDTALQYDGAAFFTPDTDSFTATVLLPMGDTI